MTGPFGWRWHGQGRPPFAVEPGPGQESVWDYPRPPRVEPDPRPVRVEADGIEVAASGRALRVLETASPPTFYLPLSDVRHELLVPAAGRSYCEWKGPARYWSLQLPAGVRPQVGWTYPDPLAPFASLRDHVAFYPARVACFVDGARVEPQPGRFYGGWVTPELVGPFKGEPGSEGW